MATNISELLSHHVSTRPNAPFLYEKKAGTYSPITFKEVDTQVTALAKSFIKQAIKPGDKVALLSDNRPEWAIVDLALQKIGAVNVPIYTTLSKEEIKYIVKDCGAKRLITETTIQKNTLASIENEIEALKGIHSIEEEFKSLLDLAAKDPEPNWPTVTREDVASIVYTSGTTGKPKGVMLTHGNFLSNVEGIKEALPLDENDRVLSFLPLSHVFERTTGYYVLLDIGGTIYYAESIDTVADNLQEVSPTVLISVPRLYDKIRTKIISGLKGAKKPIFWWAQSVGSSYMNTQSPGPFLSLKYRLADKLVFSKIRAKTGGKLRFFVSGGAPLPKEIGEFFHNCGLNIIEGYGLTESAPVIACNRLEKIKFGTVGKALPNVDVKLASDGELLAKGPSIMKGYYNLPKETQESLDNEGWLHTGDIAQIDEDGYIAIVDRKKELIVLSNGKKVAPQLVETKASLSPYVAQIVVTGEKKNFITAIIVPDFASINQWRESRDLPEASPEELVNDPTTQTLINAELTKYQVDLARFETIKKFTLIPNEFTIESGELTPSMKPKRKIVRENYKKIIEAMYEEC